MSGRLNAEEQRVQAKVEGGKQLSSDDRAVVQARAKRAGLSNVQAKAAVDAVQEGQRLTIFVGSASGGVWKSLNGGATFKPVFDKQPVQSIGAITIDPKNPNALSGLKQLEPSALPPETP